MSSINEKTEDEDEFEDDCDFGTKGEQLAAPCKAGKGLQSRKALNAGDRSDKRTRVQKDKI